MACQPLSLALALAPAAADAAATCDWCDNHLGPLVTAGRLKRDATGDDVKKLHEHLKKFGMSVELGEWKDKDAKFHDSPEVSQGKWGAATTRAVRMFGLHPVVGAESARVIRGDGKALTADLVPKLQDWCKRKVVSPQHYWEVRDLQIKDGDLDAAGAHADPAKQTVLHDFIVQIEKDLMATGFAVHSDSICGLGASHKPKGVFKSAASVDDDGDSATPPVHPDKQLTDLVYLTKKFQRQAQWLWRMKKDGTHLPNAAAGDATVYGGSSTGEVNELTAKVLHEWATKDLHMVIKKFPLVDLHWPPVGGRAIANAPSTTAAHLREDAYAAWVAAAKDISRLNATIQGPYASSPRGWKGGRPRDDSGSPFSWHYSGLAFDLSQALQMGDGTISPRSPYGLQKDGRKFVLWCWVDPQPDKPANPRDDYKATDLRQYRNRNIKAKHDRGDARIFSKPELPADPTPLYFATSRKNSAGTDVVDVTAREGWYVNVTAILESYGLKRIVRHEHNWLTNPRAWEWWHYQFEPDPPPGSVGTTTFGEYLQIHGVHEYLLRHVERGWPNHEDIEHSIG